MKKLVVLILLLLSGISFGQTNTNYPENSIYKNFRPFPTPRTNYRAGTVYRVAPDNKIYVVEDVKAVNSYESNEGTVVGRMTFSSEEILALLNIELEKYSFVSLEVEMKDVVREYTEQTTVDKVLWENERVENLVVDPMSKYFIIRETLKPKEITYRFSEETYKSILSGANNLQKTAGEGIDFPYYTSRKYKEPVRLFYLDQSIGLKPYGKK
ncbi:MAG: hypothetical protein F9K45_10785 [Melioribacteraceae bacterium]|nr:MAG: hypothetical protein F9K45_10785 [Melioribacteraceae bacterium]